MASIGLDAKLYRGTANGAASTLMTNVRDLTWNDERGEADASTRISDVELTVSGMRKVSLEWEMIAAGDATSDYGIIKAAYLGRTAVALKVLDEGTHGILADWVIIKMTQGQPLNGTNTVQVTAKPTYMGATPRYPSLVSS